MRILTMTGWDNMKNSIFAAILLTGCMHQPYENPYLDGKHAAGSSYNTSFEQGKSDGSESGRAIAGGIAQYKKDLS